MKKWFSRCAIILTAAGFLAAVDSFLRPAAWTLTSAIPSQSLPEKADTVKPTVDKTAQNPNVEERDAKWFAAQLAGGTAIAIDARPHEEYIAGHVPGAISLPFEYFTKGKPEVLDYLPEDNTLIIYCAGGDCDASHKVQTMLTNYGFTKSVVFDPGFPGWQSAGEEIETGQSATQ